MRSTYDDGSDHVRDPGQEIRNGSERRHVMSQMVRPTRKLVISNTFTGVEKSSMVKANNGEGAISESVLWGLMSNMNILSTEPFNAAGAIESNTTGGKETGSGDMVSKIADTGQEKHIPAQSHECFKGVDTVSQSIETDSVIELSDEDESPSDKDFKLEEEEIQQFGGYRSPSPPSMAEYKKLVDRKNEWPRGSTDSDHLKYEVRGYLVKIWTHREEVQEQEALPLVDAVRISLQWSQRKWRPALRTNYPRDQKNHLHRG